jgi:phage terminase large subunit-like protein
VGGFSSPESQPALRTRFPGRSVIGQPSAEKLRLSAGPRNVPGLLPSGHFNVVTVTPDKDKLSRVISQGDLFEGGSISVPARAEWRDGFLGELLAFPGGQNDDQVDALVQGLAWQRRSVAAHNQSPSDDGILGWI